MAWVYLPESAALSSACSSPCPHTVPSLLWRKKPLTSRVWRRECKRGTLAGALSGLMLKPSALSRGVASWISSLRAIRASRSARAASSSAPQTHDGSGPTSPASSERSSQNGCSLKTWSATSPTALSTPGMTFAEWASSLRAESSPRLKSARRTFAEGYSFWPTPVTSAGDRGPTTYSRGNPSMLLAARLWARPIARARNSPTSNHACLIRQARLWATPTVEAAEGRKGAYAQGGMGIQAQARLWATPSATDAKGSMRPGQRRRQLSEQALLHHGPPPAMTSKDGDLSHATPLPLNPSFLEWLMDVPIGWTALEPLGTPSFRQWSRTHGAPSLAPISENEA